MINPSVCKRVRVTAEPVVGTTQHATIVEGRFHKFRLEVNDIRHGFLKPGSRYAYLKYSIFSDCYYLTRCA